MAVIKHFVKVIFPFLYDKKSAAGVGEVIVSTKKGIQYKLFQSIGFEHIELRKGLTDLFSSEENKSKIMYGYRIDKNMREQVGLPKKVTESISFFCRAKECSEPYEVEIVDVVLYLFESEIGFVEVEFKHHTDEMEKIISCNYFLSEIGDSKNYFVIEQKNWCEESQRIEIQEKRVTLAELLKRVLDHIPGVVDFYSGLPWERVYKKGITYSYVLLSERAENFDELLFRLRLNYKESYKAPVSDIKTEPLLLQQFENSYWVSSYNGAANVSIKIDDPVTNSFFENDFYIKMKNEYFILFLAVLHQRYTILKLMWKMGELDRMDLDYKAMKEQLIGVRKYQAEAASLKFRDFFRFPSYIQHINTYYEYLYKTLCVEEMYINLTQELSNIEEICAVYVKRISQFEAIRRKIRKAIVKTITTLIGAGIGVITLLNESWLILETTCGIPTGTFTVPVLLVTTILAVPSVIGVMEAFGNVRELIKEKKESESEMIMPEKRKKKNRRIEKQKILE